MNRLARCLRMAGAAFRAIWLVLGMSLVVLVVVEVAYRTQAAVRSPWVLARSPGARADHPYFGSAWFAEYQRERAATEAPSRALVWSSYVYWRRKPYAGTYINVDTSGHRVTPQPPSLGTPAQQAWFFGASTMWGTSQRDSFTIPAVAARAWSEHGVRDLQVTNRGEYGYVFTQEVLALELALRRGERPALVIFLDGLCDVASATMNGRAGFPENEINRVAEFRLGRLLSPLVQGTADEPLAVGASVAILLRRFVFVERVLEFRPRSGRATPPAPLLGVDVVRTYAATAEWVEALAARYGFVPFYFWQPSPLTTRKPLTAFERAVMATAPSSAGRRVSKLVYGVADGAVDSAMAPVAGRRFVNLSRIFDRDTLSVFLDPSGHTTEAGAAQVAAAIADTVLALWRPGAASRPPGATSLAR
jgi:hypothetical protein